MKQDVSFKPPWKGLRRVLKAGTSFRGRPGGRSFQDANCSDPQRGLVLRIAVEVVPLRLPLVLCDLPAGEKVVGRFLVEGQSTPPDAVA
jgi:hypothetical protein